MHHDPHNDPYDVATIKVEALAWFDQPDIVAAACFTVTRVMTGQTITKIDAYLMTDGRVETWEDDGVPDLDHGGEYSGRPHEDWLGIIQPLFRDVLRTGKPIDPPAHRLPARLN